MVFSEQPDGFLDAHPSSGLDWDGLRGRVEVAKSIYCDMKSFEKRVVGISDHSS